MDVVDMVEAISEGEVGTRISRIMLKSRRRNMAEAMASTDEDLTQVGVRDDLVRFEEQVLEEVDGDINELNENVLRMAALNKLSERMGED